MLLGLNQYHLRKVTLMKTPLTTMVILTLSLSAPFAAGDEQPQQRTVAVTGTAVTRTVPDVISWHVSTSDTDKDLMTAKAKSDAKMRTILGLKDELGVEPGDMQTGHLSVRKEYMRDRTGNRGEFRHFAVSRQVTLKQRNAKRFDEFLTKLLSAAEMEVSFTFAASRVHDLRAETRLKALRVAREKAESMANALGAKAGRVLTIEEHQPRGYVSPVSNMASFDAGGPLPEDVAGGTFAPGAIEVRISVHVVFELE